MGVHLQRGWKLFELERYRECRSEFLRAKASDADTVEASIGLGWVSIQLGEPEQALLHAQEVVAAAPHESRAYSILGYVAQKMGRFAEAEGHYREALRLEPERLHHRVLLAEVLILAGRNGEAEAEAREGLAQDPRCLECRTVLVKSQIPRNRVREASFHAAEGLALHPDSPVAHKLVAMAALAEGDIRSARRHSYEALRTDPSDAEAKAVYTQALREDFPVYSWVVRVGMGLGRRLNEPGKSIASLHPLLGILCTVVFVSFAVLTQSLTLVLFWLRRETRILLQPSEARSVPWLSLMLGLAAASIWSLVRTGASIHLQLGLAALLLLEPVLAVCRQLGFGYRGTLFYLTIPVGIAVTGFSLCSYFTENPAVFSYSWIPRIGSFILCLMSFSPYYDTSKSVPSAAEMRDRGFEE